MNGLSMIVAFAHERVIGNDNKMPWNYPEDLKRFRKITKNHPIIMGRKTHESIGRPLPKRENIIVTRNREYETKGCYVVNSIKEAISKATELSSETPFVIGGAEIYKLALSYANRVFVTAIDKTFDGDVKFPCLSFDDWNVVDLSYSEKHREITYITYERRSEILD